MSQQLCLFDDEILGGPLEEPTRERFLVFYGHDRTGWFRTKTDVEGSLNEEFGFLIEVIDSNPRYAFAYAVPGGRLVARVADSLVGRPRV